MKLEFKNLNYSNNFRQAKNNDTKANKNPIQTVSSKNMLNSMNLMGSVNKSLVKNNISFTSLVTKDNWDMLDTEEIEKAYNEFGAALLDDEYPRRFPYKLHHSGRTIIGNPCPSPVFIADKEKLYKRIDTAKKILMPFMQEKEGTFYNSEYFTPELFKIAFDKKGENEKERQNFALLIKNRITRVNDTALDYISKNMVKDGEFNQDLVDYVTYICKDSNKDSNAKKILRHREYKYDQKTNYKLNCKKFNTLVQMYKAGDRDFQDIYTNELDKHLEKINISPADFAKIYKDYDENNLSDEDLDILADLKLAAEAGKFDRKFLDEFSDLDLDSRLDIENKVDNEKVKADLIKSKYSTYYKVENKTNKLFATDEANRCVNAWGGHFIDEESICSRSYHNRHDPLKIEFPKGTWIPITGIKHIAVHFKMGAYRPYGEEGVDYAKETYKVNSDGNITEISLNKNQTEYFEKTDNDSDD